MAELGAAKRQNEDIQKVVAKRALKKERILKDKDNPLVLYDEIEFLRWFGLRKHTAIRIIEVLDLPEKSGYRKPRLPPLFQVCVPLRYLATGSFMMKPWIDVHQTTVRKVLWAFVQTLLEVFLPNMMVTESSHMASLWHYENTYGFSKVIGVTDCVHFRIKRPMLHFRPGNYCNRQGKSSINVLLTCDHEGYFMDVDCSWPGAVPDSRVFRVSNFYNRLYTKEIDGVVLVDKALPLTPFSITPFEAPMYNEMSFNERHFRAWSVMQRAVAQLKNRFRVLRFLRFASEKIPSILLAAIALHNIAREEKEPYDEECWNRTMALGQYHEPYFHADDDELEETLKEQGQVLRNQFVQSRVS